MHSLFLYHHLFYNIIRINSSQQYLLLLLHLISSNKCTIRCIIMVFHNSFTILKVLCALYVHTVLSHALEKPSILILPVGLWFPSSHRVTFTEYVSLSHQFLLSLTMLHLPILISCQFITFQSKHHPLDVTQFTYLLTYQRIFCLLPRFNDY